MLRRKAEVFAPTDGVVRLCMDSPEREQRGADFTDPALLEPVCSMAFRRMRISSRDVELADSTGCEITAKVEVRQSPLINANNDVELGGKPYEVTRVENRGRTCWLWLSEIASDGTVDLMPCTTTRDSHGIPTGPTSDSGNARRVWCRRIAPSSRRTMADGVDSLVPTMTIRIRTIDYAGEPKLMRSDIEYSVISTEGHGTWVDLACARKVSDR